MKIIRKYDPNELNTFNTSVFGKEQIVHWSGHLYLVLPVFNLGIKHKSKAIYLNNAYILFKSVSNLSVSLLPYRIGEIVQLDYSAPVDYKIVVQEDREEIECETEAISYRDNREYYMTLNVSFRSCSIVYDFEIEHMLVGVLDFEKNSHHLGFLKESIPANVFELEANT